MLQIRYTNQMKRDLKLQIKRGKDPALLQNILELLVNKTPLPPANKDHQLDGEWKDFRECHIQNDWLLIYYINEKELMLTATRTGTHADFGW
jgi:mRNA interferase YafQ